MEQKKEIKGLEMLLEFLLQYLFAIAIWLYVIFLSRPFASVCPCQQTVHHEVNLELRFWRKRPLLTLPHPCFPDRIHSFIWGGGGGHLGGGV